MGRTREKQCDRCQQTASPLYRVQTDDSGAWQFICDRCLPTVKENNPHYVYGGTWKAHKRH